jgi:hypothetical protein
MAFKVKFTEKQEKLEEYETSDAYDFLEGGVLSIAFGNEEQWTEYHAPGRWVQVTAEPNHPLVALAVIPMCGFSRTADPATAALKTG